MQQKIIIWVKLKSEKEQIDDKTVFDSMVRTILQNFIENIWKFSKLNIYICNNR
jgi:hypothetical protein